MGVFLTQEAAIANMAKRYNNKFDYSKVVYRNTRTPITIICPKHGEFTTTYESHMRGSKAMTGGCRKCNNELTGERSRVPLEELKARLEKVFAGKDYIVDYNTYTGSVGVGRIWVECSRHGKWCARVWHLLNGHGCPKCGIERKADAQMYTTEWFKTKAKKIHGDKYDYSKVVYIGTDTPVEIICPEHGTFWQRPHNHLSSIAPQGCPECYKKTCKSMQPKPIHQFIKDAKEVHGDKYNYSKVVYVNNKTPVTVVCPIHGDFKISPNSHISSRVGCPVCAASTPEKIIWNFLTRNNISFIFQFKLELFDYKWDFYLNDINVVIEYNGAQHYTEVEVFNRSLDLQTRQLIDSVKLHILKQKGISCIILDYTIKSEDIPKILSEQLSKYATYCYKGKFYKTLKELHTVKENKDEPMENLYPYFTKNLYKNI